MKNFNLKKYISEGKIHEEQDIIRKLILRVIKQVENIFHTDFDMALAEVYEDIYDLAKEEGYLSEGRINEKISESFEDDIRGVIEIIPDIVYYDDDSGEFALNKEEFEDDEWVETYDHDGIYSLLYDMTGGALNRTLLNLPKEYPNIFRLTIS